MTATLPDREIDRGMTTAHLCMTIIGIGYLFPIAAVWAAYDYWKLLFPEINFEFGVTETYQLGALITVAALSTSNDFNIHRRIYSGFSGQFFCLLVILSTRWLNMESIQLYHFLLLIVFICSVATGFLDSALLSLCAHYSPEMQASLQIGIGFGCIVSLLYRDLTKIFVSSDVADATCMFFIVALCTVILCMVAYRKLMQLPVSWHIAMPFKADDDKLEPLQGTPAGYGRQTSNGNPQLRRAVSGQGSWTPNQGMVSPMPARDIDNINDIEDADQEEDSLKPELKDKHFVREVIGKVWVNEVAILLNFVITTTCYPAMITCIPCRNLLWLKQGQWFQTLLLTVFGCADVAARFFTHRRFGLRHDNIMLTVVVRSVLIPLMLFCVLSPYSNDLIAFAVTGLFGALNGWCVSVAFIVINEVPGLSLAQRAAAGRLSAMSTNTGLLVGSIVAGLLDHALGLGSS